MIISSYVLRADLADAGLLATHSAVENCAAGSRWIDIDPRLELTTADHRLRRNRPSAFFGGKLHALLNEWDSDLLLLAGLSVNNAISATARDAFALDIPFIVVRECTGAAPGKNALDTYFEMLDTWTAEVASSMDVVERLSS